jgi:cyanophycinase
MSLRTSWLRLGILSLVSLLLPSCGGEQSGPGPFGADAAPPGTLVIVGGGLRSDNTAVYQAVLDGRSGDGPLCVIPTASATPEPSMESAVSAFDAVGGPGTAVGVLLTVDNPEEAFAPERVDEIRSCSGFYFTGGVQTRIVQVFRPGEEDSPAFAALSQRHRDGVVVAGSSAGAAIMTDPMTGGGSSIGALLEGIRGSEDEDREGVILEKGLGFLEGAFVDQHFLARGRWGRLLVAILAVDGRDFGLGIDENTALVVQGNMARVVGESGVIFLDVRNAVREEGGYGGSNVILHLLGPGDGVDLLTGSVHLDASKPRLAGAEKAFQERDMDLFDRWTLLHFLSEVATVPDTLFTFRQDSLVLEFRKGPGFQARGWDEPGVEGAPRGFYAGPMTLGVGRENMEGGRQGG